MSSTTVDEGSAASAGGSPAVPADKVNLRLLLVSGKKADVLVAPTDRVETVKEKIFGDWPKDWTDEIPTGPTSLRILLRGRFLEDGTTVGDARIPAGQTTIVHLLVRPDAGATGGSASNLNKNAGTGGAADDNTGGRCCAIL
ncbi:hypothetical protein HK405_013126 [Cladochytrium tenue]|nr:hypothetical protein HK405_013126 [Cladochytrium tenue]